MSTDPYHVVQQEIQSSLQTASTLRASYLRIRSTAREGSEELVWARNELKATLAALEADLEDLEESVKVVESTGPRLFNLDDAEVTERRRYVGRVRREITSMRAEVEDTTTHLRSPFPQSPTAAGSQSGVSTTSNSPRNDDRDEDEQWAREERQLMIQEQDRTMVSISGTLTTLAQQAGLMGQEIGQHNEMLVDLERNVDRTDSKLDSAMRKMKKFIRQTEDTKSGWCITILIIILVILFLAVILV
ncbi:t-SNARE [Boletus edulis]|uniref:t-SNARE n=1 Tax=Boletus edulis BED1 TaxID=1328754 RepID=A0AAD4BSU0_BOLED|nr:t-SNARE [Boletus edulis]KAF8438968.1 t-SNARE [Boletus edulis BED1]